jgi:Flp pilus assembly protein TadG
MRPPEEPCDMRTVLIPEQRRARRRGAAILETAFILPLFLMFWFGIVDWGIAFFMQETMVHRANAALRWAVVNDYDVAKIKNVLLHDDPNSTLGNTAWFSLHEPTVSVQLAGAAATNDRRIVLTVSNYQWMHFTPFFAGRYFGRPLTVSMPVEDLASGS